MGKVLDSVKGTIRNRHVLLGIRLVLGSIFILAASGKLPNQAKFVEVVTGYGLLPWDLAHAYGLVLPWIELTVGIFLVVGLLSRFAAGASIIMIISFIVANGTSVFEQECYCFGDFILIKTSDALIMDVVMMAMAFVLLLYGGGFLSLDSRIRTNLKLGLLDRAKSGE